MEASCMTESMILDSHALPNLFSEAPLKECIICCTWIEATYLLSFPYCKDECCKDCMIKYFMIQIKDSVSTWMCAICHNPSIHDLPADDRKAYFRDVVQFIVTILDNVNKDELELRIQKHLLTYEPNFKRCPKCNDGFLGDLSLSKQTCGHCQYIFCSLCQDQWSKDHEFENCLETNDFSFVKSELICPKCKVKGPLIRGGCIHLECPYCKYNYCQCCFEEYYKDDCRQSCTIRQGLHAHHPRNCYYYMRDKDLHELETLLKEHNVSYDKTPPAGSIRCLMAIIEVDAKQKTIDRLCNEQIYLGKYCLKHFFEYLGYLIFKNKVDPLPIFDLNNSTNELKRRMLPLPERGPYDTDPLYNDKCKEVIKNCIRLK